jgi:hypothetical protein
VAVHLGAAGHRGRPQAAADLVRARSQAGPLEDGLDAAKSRFSGIVADLGLETPKELSQ